MSNATPDPAAAPYSEEEVAAWREAVRRTPFRDSCKMGARWLATLDAARPPVQQPATGSAARAEAIEECIRVMEDARENLDPNYSGHHHDGARIVVASAVKRLRSLPVSPSRGEEGVLVKCGWCDGTGTILYESTTGRECRTTCKMCSGSGKVCEAPPRSPQGPGAQPGGGGA